MSRNVRKSIFWHGHPTKTHISLRIYACWSESLFSKWRSILRPGKILITLCECAGWSEFSLGSHVRRYVFWHCSSYSIVKTKTIGSTLFGQTKKDVFFKYSETITPYYVCSELWQVNLRHVHGSKGYRLPLTLAGLGDCRMRVQLVIPDAHRTGDIRWVRYRPSQHSTYIYIGPSMARQSSWRADDGPM